MRPLKLAVYGAGLFKVISPIGAFLYSYFNQSLRTESSGPNNFSRLANVYNPNGGGYALVTGGSEGIGREFALDLARSGFNLVLASKSITKLEAVAQECKAVNPRIDIRLHSIDLTSSEPSDLKALLDGTYPLVGENNVETSGDPETIDLENFSLKQEVKPWSGDLRIVVNNAATISRGKLFEMNP